jgi:hypothetical protein
LTKQEGFEVAKYAATAVAGVPTIEHVVSTVGSWMGKGGGGGGKKGAAAASGKNGSKKEGFAQIAEYSPADAPGYIIDPMYWSSPSLVFKAGSQPDAAVQAVLDRKSTQASGIGGFLEGTEFKPSCCPSMYTNSSGCACLTMDQYNYLEDRGGNNPGHPDTI